MSIKHPASEDSLAIAMIELDRLERERRDIEEHRRQLHATTRRQADDIRELRQALRASWPRAIARQRRRASAEHERARAHERRLVEQVEREHADRLVALTQSNAERRAALARLEREVVAEFNPARAALVWLTPFAAAGLVAALGFMLVQDHHEAAPTDLTGSSATPLSAVADPLPTDPSDDEPVIVSDADAPAIEPAIEPVLAPVSTPSKPSSTKKPSSSKPSKPAAPVTKPVTKPHSKPIVLDSGDDPLGNL